MLGIYLKTLRKNVAFHFPPSWPSRRLFLKYRTRKKASKYQDQEQKQDSVVTEEERAQARVKSA